MKASRLLRSVAIFIYYLPSNLINTLRFRISNIRYGRGLQTKGSIFVRSKGQVLIGNNVRINSSPFANPIGGNERTCLQILSGARLVIGNNTGLSCVSITCAKSITIGNNVRIGSGCCIFDTDFHSLHPQRRAHRSAGVPEDIHSDPIEIGDYAFIGTRVIILKGSKIGRNSIVGAGAVVSGIIPENEIWAGNPARRVRSLTPDEIA